MGLPNLGAPIWSFVTCITWGFQLSHVQGLVGLYYRTFLDIIGGLYRPSNTMKLKNASGLRVGCLKFWTYHVWGQWLGVPAVVRATRRL